MKEVLRSMLENMENSSSFKKAFENVPDDLFWNHEEQLASKIKPTFLIEMLRFNFWKCLGRKQIFKASDVFGPICTYPHWHGLIKRPEVVAYLLTPINRKKRLIV